MSCYMKHCNRASLSFIYITKQYRFAAEQSEYQKPKNEIRNYRYRPSGDRKENADFAGSAEFYPTE